jgi:subtilase family serine protease
MPDKPTKKSVVRNVYKKDRILQSLLITFGLLVVVVLVGLASYLAGKYIDKKITTNHNAVHLTVVRRETITNPTTKQNTVLTTYSNGMVKATVNGKTLPVKKAITVTSPTPTTTPNPASNTGSQSKAG